MFWEIEHRACEELRKARVDNPGLSARVLLKHASQKNDAEYLLSRHEIASEQIKIIYKDLIRRRKKGEPVAYITGYREFYGRNFWVDSNTLIPRPETEQLVDVALKKLSANKLDFLDLGCGCGNIGLTLSAERPEWNGILMDNSSGAVKIAKKNLHALHLSPLIISGDIFNWPFQHDTFDLIISNPPYIARSDRKNVMWEVLKFEPQSALFSLKNGLNHIEALIRSATFSLKNGGTLILEHGCNQSETIIQFLKKYGYNQIDSFQDLANLPRCIIAKLCK